MPGFEPRFVDFTKLGPDAEVIASATIGSDEPFDAAMILIRALYLEASRQGANVVLDGAASDQLLAYGSWTGRLFQQGRPIAAAREIAALRGSWGQPGFPFGAVVNEAATALAPSFLRRARRSLQVSQGASNADLTIFQPDFVARHNLEERYAVKPGARELDLPYLAERARSVSRPNLTVGRERYNRVAATAGVEARDPFMDLEVVQFCASLPGHQRLRNGFPKFILRNAMSGSLPDDVCWRRSREHVGTDFVRAVMADSWPQWRSDLTNARDRLAQIVLPEVLKEAEQTGRFHKASAMTHHLVILAAWLNRH